MRVTPVTYPVPLIAPVEGNGEGDTHVIAVDKDNGILYELYKCGNERRQMIYFIGCHI